LRSIIYEVTMFREIMTLVVCLYAIVKMVFSLVKALDTNQRPLLFLSIFLILMLIFLFIRSVLRIIRHLKDR
jgi:hypothetical protein